MTDLNTISPISYTYSGKNFFILGALPRLLSDEPRRLLEPSKLVVISKSTLSIACLGLKTGLIRYLDPRCVPLWRQALAKISDPNIYEGMLDYSTFTKRYKS